MSRLFGSILIGVLFIAGVIAQEEGIIPREAPTIEDLRRAGVRQELSNTPLTYIVTFHSVLDESQATNAQYRAISKAFLDTLLHDGDVRGELNITKAMQFYDEDTTATRIMMNQTAKAMRIAKKDAALAVVDEIQSGVDAY